MKEELFDLRGEVALVTGGSKGIGKHLGCLLARHGASVALASRNLKESQDAAQEIKNAGGEAIGVFVDVSRVETVSSMIGRVMEWKGRLDVLVNNAGTNVRKPALEFSEEEWDRILETNLKGAFFCSQAAAKEMIPRGGGRILNVSSAAGGMPVPWLAPYSISKAGLNHLTRILALEWAPYNIRVNGIAPTYIETPLTKQWLSDPKRYEMLRRRSPMRRLATLSDLDGAVLLLVTQASSFITGQTIFVDGGSGAGWALQWETPKNGQPGENT